MKHRFPLILLVAASVLFISVALAKGEISITQNDSSENTGPVHKRELRKPPCAATTVTYQVVAGDNDNAYLVNTETGAVWILTYRTLATGREPIAIPYRFLKIKPGDQTFLFEEYKGPTVEGPKRDTKR
jgi:hypothetical protein